LPPEEKEKRIAPKRVAKKPEAKSLRDSGLSYEEIAKIVGVSKSTVFKWLNLVKYN